MFSPLPSPPPRSMLGLTPKRPDSSNFMANGNNIEKGARGMEMFPTLKGIRRSVPTVLKVIVEPELMILESDIFPFPML